MVKTSSLILAAEKACEDSKRIENELSCTFQQLMTFRNFNHIKPESLHKKHHDLYSIKKAIQYTKSFVEKNPNAIRTLAKLMRGQGHAIFHLCCDFLKSCDASRSLEEEKVFISGCRANAIDLFSARKSEVILLKNALHIIEKEIKEQNTDLSTLLAEKNQVKNLLDAAQSKLQSFMQENDKIILEESKIRVSLRKISRIKYDLAKELVLLEQSYIQELESLLSFVERLENRLSLDDIGNIENKVIEIETDIADLEALTMNPEVEQLLEQNKKELVAKRIEAKEICKSNELSLRMISKSISAVLASIDMHEKLNNLRAELSLEESAARKNNDLKLVISISCINEKFGQVLEKYRYIKKHFTRKLEMYRDALSIARDELEKTDCQIKEDFRLLSEASESQLSEILADQGQIELLLGHSSAQNHVFDSLNESDVGLSVMLLCEDMNTLDQLRTKANIIESNLTALNSNLAISSLIMKSAIDDKKMVLKEKQSLNQVKKLLKEISKNNENNVLSESIAEALRENESELTAIKSVHSNISEDNAKFIGLSNLAETIETTRNNVRHTLSKKVVALSNKYLAVKSMAENNYVAEASGFIAIKR